MTRRTWMGFIGQSDGQVTPVTAEGSLASGELGPTDAVAIYRGETLLFQATLAELAAYFGAGGAAVHAEGTIAYPNLYGPSGFSAFISDGGSVFHLVLAEPLSMDRREVLFTIARRDAFGIGTLGAVVAVEFLDTSASPPVDPATRVTARVFDATTGAAVDLSAGWCVHVVVRELPDVPPIPASSP